MRPWQTIFLFILFCGLFPFQGLAQKPSEPRIVEIIYSDHWHYEETPTGLQEWVGGRVILRHDSTYMFCDTAHLFGSIVIAIGNISILEGDSLRIFADSLIYNSTDKTAILTGNVLLENGSQRLITDHLVYNTLDRVGSYNTGAWLQQEDMKIYSRTGRYLVGEQTVFFKDSVQMESPDFRLKADSLYYKIQEERVYFTGPTLIKQPGSDLYCESGYYDMRGGFGWFEQNAQFADSTRQATANRIYYNSLKKDIVLIGNADYREGARLATGDTLAYNEITADFKIRGNAFLQDGIQTITADGINFNTKTERMATLGRSLIRDGAQILEADDISNSDSTDLVMMRGHVIWRDTLAGITLTCDSAHYQRSIGYFEAMGNPPILINVIDGDTLYLIADHIISYKDESSDSSRIIKAFHHVFVYKSDLQVICDSTVYLSRDSMFHFYMDPVVWSEDTTQFSSDTLSIRLANQKMDSIFLKKKSIIISTPDGTYFDQIKGRDITGSFQENVIHRMDVLGNAEAIYYALDEQNAYIGVNKSECSEMILLFEENQVKDIYYLREPKSAMFPMGQIDHNTLRLDGFNWRLDERPSSLENMLERWHKAHGRLQNDTESSQAPISEKN